MFKEVRRKHEHDHHRNEIYKKDPIGTGTYKKYDISNEKYTHQSKSRLYSTGEKISKLDNITIGTMKNKNRKRTEYKRQQSTSDL